MILVFLTILSFWQLGPWTATVGCVAYGGQDAVCGFTGDSTIELPSIEAAEEYGARHPEYILRKVEHRGITFTCPYIDGDEVQVADGVFVRMKTYECRPEMGGWIE